MINYVNFNYMTKMSYLISCIPFIFILNKKIIVNSDIYIRFNAYLTISTFHP